MDITVKNIFHCRESNKNIIVSKASSRGEVLIKCGKQFTFSLCDSDDSLIIKVDPNSPNQNWEHKFFVDNDSSLTNLIKIEPGNVVITKKTFEHTLKKRWWIEKGKPAGEKKWVVKVFCQAKKDSMSDIKSEPSGNISIPNNSGNVEIGDENQVP